jgi:hypothetical protein
MNNATRCDRRPPEVGKRAFIALRIPAGGLKSASMAETDSGVYHAGSSKSGRLPLHGRFGRAFFDVGRCPFDSQVRATEKPSTSARKLHERVKGLALPGIVPPLIRGYYGCAQFHRQGQIETVVHCVRFAAIAMCKAGARRYMLS